MDPHFKFRGNIIVVDLDNCLVKKSTPKQMEDSGPVIFNQPFFTAIMEESKTKDIVVLSNQPVRTGIAENQLKMKIHFLTVVCKLPLLVMVAFERNKFWKPHTGMYQLLKNIYAQRDVPIQRVKFVSNLGGVFFTTPEKKVIKMRNDATDRDMAANCGVDYFTIDEFLDSDYVESYLIEAQSIPPQFRMRHIREINAMDRVTLMQQVQESKAQAHLILISGVPGGGKTTVAASLMKEWNESVYGKTNAVKLFTLTQTQKAPIAKFERILSNRISIIVDGHGDTAKQRAPYEQLASKLSVRLLHVYVSPGELMASILNRFAVEKSDQTIKLIHGKTEYDAHRGIYVPAKYTLEYIPRIQEHELMLKFRF